MSKAEKIVVIILIFTALTGTAVSYYNKISQNRIRIIPAAATQGVERAKDIIAERGIIYINTADRHTLTKLPGIGPSLAQRIVDYRQQSGRFSSSSDLMKVKGIGPEKYRSIKDYIRVDE